MVNILFPLTSPELNVNNALRVNSSIITFGGIGATAPFFANSSVMVINSVTGRANLSTTSLRISNGTTYFNNLNSVGHYFENPTISTQFAYNQVNCVEASGAKEYHITIGRFEITNSLGFSLSANLTDMWVGSDVAANVAKLTSTQLSLKNTLTLISTTNLSINGQALMNSSSLTVGAATITNINLKNGSQGNAAQLSLFTSTANGVVPGTNTFIGNNYILHGDGAWHPPDFITVASGNLQGTPAAPNDKFVEIMWGNNVGDVHIDGWFAPQSNVTTFHCYLFFNGGWVNTGADYETTRYLHTGTTFSFDDNQGENTIELSDGVCNAANRSTHLNLHLFQARSTANICLKYEVISANSTTNSLPRITEGWSDYTGGSVVNANGVMGIRFYFATGNIASAQWTARATHRRQ